MTLQYQWNIDGHTPVLENIEADIKNNNIVHAYLFSGPKDVGKYTIAKTLASILQCPQNYCHTCFVCREIEKGYHADTLEIPNDGESIKIEQIRAVLDRLNMSTQSRYKILLVQDIERMTAESANALLKTLEDPPGHVLFLLTSSNVKEVLPTILSRVRNLKFRKVSDADIQALIRKNYPLVDDSMVETVTHFSLGRPGKAFSFMSDPSLYESYRKLFADIEEFLRVPDRSAQFAYIGDLVALAKERSDGDGSRLIQDFLEVFLAILRKQLLMKARGEHGILPEEKILHLIEQIQKSQPLMQRNVNARLLLENIMLSL